MIFGITEPWAIALFILAVIVIVVTIIRIIYGFICIGRDKKIKEWKEAGKFAVKDDSVYIDGVTYNYTTSTNNVHIENSYNIHKWLFEYVLAGIRSIYTDIDVWKRTINSMRREWAAHNLCYALGIKRDRVKDIDLNYPQKWYVRLIYWVVGNISLLFVK